MHDFSRISIYFDASRKLVGVPCGKNPKDEHGTVEVDIFFTLDSGYSDDELEIFITNVFDACYSKEYVEGEPTAIQKYTKAKNYVSATKGYQFILVSWLKDEGYTISPWKADKKYRGSFVPINGISIKVSLYSKHKPVEKGALALAFRKAMEIVEQSDS